MMTPFETKNQLFRQVMGNGLKYNVPRFQRDYSWEEEQWEDLWEDIIKAVTSRSGHYMGYLVLQSSDNKNFTVIDGQQRLTTISIFILSALYGLKKTSDREKEKSKERESETAENTEEEKNKERLATLKNSFIGFKDPVSLQTEYKLNLNRNNDKCFKSYLCELQEPPLRHTNRSERLMRKALYYFREKTKQYFREREKDRGKTPNFRGREIARLIESVADHLFFTTIIIRDTAKAYTIFETLNARGVRLSTPDLVKNYIFQTIDKKGELHDEKIKNLEDDWSCVTDQLGRYKFSHFIRIDWNSRNDFSRENELFKNIQRKIHSPETAKKYLNRLKKNSEIYAALQDENDGFWREYKDGSYNKPELISGLKTLHLFQIKQPQSALLAGFYTLNPEKFVKFLNYIEALSVRYNIICGKSTADQERAYSQAAKTLLNDGSLSSALEIIKKINPSDNETASAFERKSFKIRQTDKKVRYLLYRIEKRLRGIDPKIDFEETTLEHVLPKNPTELWMNEFDRGEDTENWIGRLGNMTLLSKEENKNLGRKEFKEKKAGFKKSGFKITGWCADYERWNKDAILSRQKRLWEQAKDIWRLTS